MRESNVEHLERLLANPAELAPRLGPDVRTEVQLALSPSRSVSSVRLAALVAPAFERAWVRRVELGHRAWPLLHADPARDLRWLLAEGLLSVRDGELPARELRALLRKGARLKLPVVSVPPRLGVDGHWTALELGPPGQKVRLEWWLDGPTAWRPLVRWCAELQALLEAHLPAPAEASPAQVVERPVKLLKPAPS